jgi:hypothetical protein
MIVRGTKDPDWGLRIRSGRADVEANGQKSDQGSSGNQREPGQHAPRVCLPYVMVIGSGQGVL